MGVRSRHRSCADTKQGFVWDQVRLLAGGVAARRGRLPLCHQCGYYGCLNLRRFGGCHSLCREALLGKLRRRMRCPFGGRCSSFSWCGGHSMAGLCGLVQSDRAANTHDQYKQNADGCGQQLHLMSVLTRCVSVLAASCVCMKRRRMCKKRERDLIYIYVFVRDCHVCMCVRVRACACACACVCACMCLCVCVCM